MSNAADFDDVASLYAVARPSYPRAAVEWLLDGGGRDVVDVGAGTGLFTRLLVGRDRTVTAVEPSERMLGELRTALPEVVALQGSGERMPLPDRSADVVAFAQAWHWVDVPAASTEVARVLRPGGRLGLVWNLRDERVAWVRALGEAMRADGDHFRGETQDPDVGAPFGEPERQFVEWVRVCTPDELLADVRSRSYFGLLPAPEHEHVISAVRGVLREHAETSSRAVLELPYVTASFRYTHP
ncbi:class I SAM-dependent methyltransferase [Microbacterium sp. P5_E9]